MSKQLLKQAYEAWNAAAEMRRRRERCKRYTYGDQWSDTVFDNEGHACREIDLVRRAGKQPLVNNLIRQLVKTVVGRYRALTAENSSYADGDIAAIARLNALAELDSRMLEEFLISGCAVQRISLDDTFSFGSVRIDNVDFRRFFVNSFTDPRGLDIDLIGMLHDMTFPELAMRFGGNSASKADALRNLYASPEATAFAPDSIGCPGADLDIFRPQRHGRCRVVEIWTLDSRRYCNGDDVAYRFNWHCRWLAPDGTLLKEYDSPYAHGGHPFAVKFYPLTDGEVHSFVEDVIDQQRSINRMVVLIDKIMATSAKGVLLFPCDQMVETMTWDEVCQRWAQSDGVIPITGRGSQLPQQVLTNPSASGAYQLLELQMRLFEQTSGVGQALSAQGASTARGAELFEAQIRNATTALADIFETYTAFTTARNEKALSTSAA